MSFLSKLFKPKPGGTFVGNLVRGVSSTVIGGGLGSGANKIELGQTKTNKELIEEAQASASSTPFPNVSSVFKAGQQDNPIALSDVPVIADRITSDKQSMLDDIQVRWSKDRKSISVGSGDSNNNMIFAGLALFGGLLLLKKL